MDVLLAEFAKRCAQADGSDLPKYKRLMQAIQGTVESGILSPGDRLPTEQDLTGAVPYALGTVQRALNALVTQGVLRRSRRSGTFVSDLARPLDDTSQFDFKRADGQDIGEVLSEITEISIVPDPAGGCPVLGACPSGYVKIERLDRIGDDFQCFVEILLRADRFAKLVEYERDALSGKNIRTILWTHFGLAVTSLEIASGAVIAPPTVARACDVKRGGLVQQTEIFGSDASGVPLYIQKTFAPVGDYLLAFRKDIN